MRIVAALSVALLALSACGDQTFKSAEDAVRLQMKDPDATQFRDIAYCGSASGGIVRGKYNGKNSYGAYEGFKPFYYEAGVAEIGDTVGLGTLINRCTAQTVLSTKAMTGEALYGGNTVDEVARNVTAAIDNGLEAKQ